jgi:hypothetical protein
MGVVLARVYSIPLSMVFGGVLVACMVGTLPSWPLSPYYLERPLAFFRFIFILSSTYNGAGTWCYHSMVPDAFLL